MDEIFYTRAKQNVHKETFLSKVYAFSEPVRDPAGWLRLRGGAGQPGAVAAPVYPRLLLPPRDHTRGYPPHHHAGSQHFREGSLAHCLSQNLVSCTKQLSLCKSFSIQSQAIDYTADRVDWICVGMGLKLSKGGERKIAYGTYIRPEAKRNWLAASVPVFPCVTTVQAIWSLCACFVLLVTAVKRLSKFSMLRRSEANASVVCIPGPCQDSDYGGQASSSPPVRHEGRHQPHDVGALHHQQHPTSFSLSDSTWFQS